MTKVNSIPKATLQDEAGAENVFTVIAEGILSDEALSALAELLVDVAQAQLEEGVGA